MLRPCCAVLCRSVGFSGTILRSNVHESKQLVLLPDVRKAVEGQGLIIWPWVSAAAALLMVFCSESMGLSIVRAQHRLDPGTVDDTTAVASYGLLLRRSDRREDSMRSLRHAIGASTYDMPSTLLVLPLPLSLSPMLMVRRSTSMWPCCQRTTGRGPKTS